MPVDRKRSLLLLLLAALAASGCSDAEYAEETRTGSDEIINGQFDPTVEAVVAIRFTVQTPEIEATWYCSGALIEPRTILTAAHCVVPQDATNRYFRHEVYFGANPGQNPEHGWQRAVKVKAHPQFSWDKIFSQTIAAYDFALLTLEQDSPIKPLRIASKIEGDLTSAKITHVGFGATTSINRTNKSGVGQKRFSVVLPVTKQLEFVLQSGNGVSGICNGDSGGPALLDVGGEKVIVGVHSFVDDSDRCLQNGFSARTDVAPDFILAGLPPSSGIPVEGQRPR